MDTEEQKLIKNAQKGENQAFAELYDKYVDKIYRFILLKVGRKEDAEDLTQQVFLKAWQNVKSYKPQGYVFSAWLYKIAHNTVIDYYRRNKSHKSLDAIQEIGYEISTTVLDDKNDLIKIKNAIYQLETTQQSVIIMKFIDELSNKEISEILGKSEGAIRVLQHRALKELKKYLENNG
ncbi:MAG: RNA polymerase sigma factor [Minisyncoccia bacterium]